MQGCVFLKLCTGAVLFPLIVLEAAIAQEVPPGSPPLADKTVQLSSGALAKQASPPSSSSRFAQVSPERITPPLPEPALPQEPLPSLPPPNELLPFPTDPIDPTPPDFPANLTGTIRVDRYQVEGSTIFDEEELAAVTEQFTGPAVSFADLLQARTAITNLYTNAGYLTSGAFIPPQTLEDNVVLIQVIEGRLEDINVTGNRRLNDSYIRSRLRLAGRTPLNVDRLLEGLQLLQLDPLIETISADLQAGVEPGTNRLEVTVDEADSFDVTLGLDNNRSPSVGSVRRRVAVQEGNLLGWGDRIRLEYTNTNGSNGIDSSYTVPVNPRNGTVQLSFGFTDSNVIEEPFDVLDINSESLYVELGYRQPLFQSPTEELVLGLTASRQESQTELGIGDIGPFPLSPGADEDGRTRISALRFSQEWVERSSRHVLAARSQFNLGVDVLDATVNEDAPDSRFFSWRGQGQWVRLLTTDALLLVRGDVQLTGDELVPLEQIGFGGQDTVRGYRQDAILTDNGATFTTELRWPILRVPEVNGLLQVAPFLDAGVGWNNGVPDPDPNFIAGLGLGLLWQMGENFSARFDWGLPLVDVDSRGDSLQEDGIYFSINFTAF